MENDDWRPKVKQIDDPIADDRWQYVTFQGKRRISRITVGRPVHYPEERIWYCPVLIEGYLPEIQPCFGQGPVDALMNAMTLVKKFNEENIEVLSIGMPKKRTPGKAPAVKRGRKTPTPKVSKARAKR